MQPDRDLERLLAAAGSRARLDRDAAPDREFAADLRDQLLAQLPDASHEPRVGWSLGTLFRLPRMLPLAAAAVLLVVSVAVGRDLYVALGDHPTPTPVPSVEATPTVDPSLSAEAVPSASFLPVVEPTVDATPEPTAKPGVDGQAKAGGFGVSGCAGL